MFLQEMKSDDGKLTEVIAESQSLTGHRLTKRNIYQ
jgi:hypothetical protein